MAGKILIVGLGEIGYSNAEYMTKIGIHADGFDISKDAVQRAIRCGVIARESKNFSGYDHYIVCISTHNPKDMFQPYLGGLYDIAERISNEGKGGALVSIESTVAMGASQRVKEILRHRLHVSHVPHRYFGPEKDRHGVKQLRVLGGCESCCVDAAEHFYSDMLEVPVFKVKQIEYAELCKLIENTERFLRISYAEELSMFCGGYGLSFNDLRDAVNTKWNAEIFEARQGIGGHCLPKDSQMYLDMTRKIMGESIIEAAKKIDIDYRRFLMENRVPLKLEQREPAPSAKLMNLAKPIEKESA